MNGSPGSGSPRGRHPANGASTALHPVAWWLWALALLATATRTTNPLLLVVLLAVLAVVVAARRGEAAWARGFRYYLILALIVIAIRVVFHAVFATGTASTDHILFSLPTLHLPHWYSGIRIGGPVSLESTLAAVCNGLQLGTLLCCVGAANALANPKRALRALPGALYELGVAVTVALSVAGQLVESAQRVRRAQRLRAVASGRLRRWRRIAVPVLADALDRSIRLAAGMDSRGYGRTAQLGRRTRRGTAALLLAGMCGLCVGLFGLLDAAAPRLLGLPALLGGAMLCCVGLALGGRRVRRTAYRPDPWRLREWTVTAGGAICAAVVISGIGTDPEQLNPVLRPLSWPALPLVPVAAMLLAGLAALAAPRPAEPRRTPAAPPTRTVSTAGREQVAA
jgi:energy-coupling factor transport system permease protein